MSGFDERKKGLEEEYFHRKEQEALEKMRAQREAEEHAANELATSLACPRCEGRLLAITYEGVEIDRCNTCNGIWLDAGELDKLTEKEEEGGFFGKMWRGIKG